MPKPNKAEPQRIRAVSEKPLLEDLYNEIDSGGLSVLSVVARQRIKDMIRLGMEDGYKRGHASGKAGRSF